MTRRPRRLHILTMEEIALLIAVAAKQDARQYGAAEARALIEKSKAIMEDVDESVDITLKVVRS